MNSCLRNVGDDDVVGVFVGLVSFGQGFVIFFMMVTLYTVNG